MVEDDIDYHYILIYQLDALIFSDQLLDHPQTDSSAEDTGRSVPFRNWSGGRSRQVRAPCLAPTSRFSLRRVGAREVAKRSDR